MIQLVTDIVIGGGALAVIYRLYLALMVGKEKLVEIKNDVKVQQDEVKDAKDEETAKRADTSFDNSVDQFNKDSKS